VADADFENEQAAIDTAIALNESGRRLRNTWLERGGRGGDRALALHRELRDPGIRYPHEVVECQLGRFAGRTAGSRGPAPKHLVALGRNVVSAIPRASASQPLSVRE
jgi:hypothetical protein